MLAALAVLHRRINSHKSPVYRLHPELLSLIASRLARDDLIKATHISYYWRAVLLAHSSLWSTLDFIRRPEQAVAFFTRSESATIHVFLPILGSIAKDSFKLLKRSADRIATLGVGNYKSQKKLLLRDMPSLRTLDLYWRHTGGRLRDCLHFPALETLSVKNTNPPPLSVPRLTRFTFSNAWAKSQSVDRLLRFLSTTPLLEELSVELDCGSNAQINHDVVHLPHLRVYTHLTETSFSPRLFDMLSCPSTCSVTYAVFRCVSWRGDPIPPFEKPPPLVRPARIKLKSRAMDDEDFFEGTVGIVDASNVRFRSTQRVILNGLAWEEDISDSVDELLPDLVRDLDCNFVTTLCVEEHAFWYYDEINCVEEMLDHLKNIKTLIISNSDVEQYLDALTPAGCKYEGRWLTAPRCPKLRSLVIHESCKLGMSIGKWILEPICPVARLRKEAGIPFRSVSVFTPLFEKLAEDLDEIEPGVKEARKWIDSFKIVTGEDAKDWNVDDYFFDGLHGIRRDWEHTTRHEFVCY